MIGYNITEDEFNIIRRLVYEKVGVNLTPAKKQLVISRLSKRLKVLELNNFSEYLNYVKKYQEEFTIMLNLITTNMTYFFRENYHFNFLSNNILPHLCIKNKNIIAWSAACSTGEEVYSIAITFAEYFARNKRSKANLFASDINTDVIKIAKEGIYKDEEVKKIRKALLPKYFKLGEGKNKGKFKIKDELKKMIKWQQINLMSDNYPIADSLDFIFCRNVFIYFDKETQGKILKKLYKYLKKGGYLFLGVSENIDLSRSDVGNWELISHSIYKTY